MNPSGTQWLEVGPYDRPIIKLTGRGKNVFFCPSCNQTKPQKGRKHVNGLAVCAQCVEEKK
jgi:formylmethanofuran dehydrogenase subunit E